MIGFGGQREWHELPALCGWALVLLGLCRCGRGAAKWNTCHLAPGAPCAIPFLPALGTAPCLPVEHPSSWARHEELAFNGALLPSSLQMEADTVENPGEWCRWITKWDYCGLVLCPEALLWTKPTGAKGTSAWQSARKMGIAQSCNWRVRWKLNLPLR